MRKRDVLDRLRDMHDVYAAGGNLLERDLRDAIAEIERLREATRWRSVAEDGLPEQGVDVVAVFPRGKRWCYRAMFRTEYKDHTGRSSNHWELAGDYVDENTDSQHEPTHWQPLPEPPK